VHARRRVLARTASTGASLTLPGSLFAPLGWGEMGVSKNGHSEGLFSAGHI